MSDEIKMYDISTKILDSLIKSGSFNDYSDLPTLTKHAAKTTIILIEELAKELDAYKKKRNLEEYARNPNYGAKATNPVQASGVGYMAGKGP